MTKTFKNILLAIAAFIIIFPAIANCLHIFSTHRHRLCDHYAKKHIHQVDLDCNLAKFHHSPSLNIVIFKIKPPVITQQINYIFSLYKFLNNYEPSLLDLRGPPALV